MTLLSPNWPMISLRAFSTSLSRPRNKERLKRLGSILQKGKVTPSDPLPPTPTSTNALQDCVARHIDDINKSFDTVGYMSRDDITIQENLDGNAQFGTYPSQHFLNRKRVIRSLPDEIDLLETPGAEVDRIFNDISRLDADPALHAKQMKQYSIQYRDLITRYRIGRNLHDWCRAGRRGERFAPLRAMDRTFANLYEYNVVGFDRSILGVPLRPHSMPSSPETRCPFPKELISDIRPFETKVPVHKKDANKADPEQMRECVTPYDLRSLPEYAALREEGIPIMVDDVDDYQNLEHDLFHLVSQLEKAVLELRDQLDLEITQRRMLTGGSLVGFSARKVKTSEFVLVSKTRDYSFMRRRVGLYDYRHFDMLPVYGFLLSTYKHHNLLYKHLFKVLLINLDEHIDVLMRIKYQLPDDAQNFLRKLYGQINLVIKLKMLPQAHFHRMKMSQDFDAVVFKRIRSLNFLRIIWLKPPGAAPKRNYKNGRRLSQRLAVGRLIQAKMIWI